MRLVFQIFTGDLTRQSLADPLTIIEKLQKAHETSQLAGVLCGWSKDTAFYRTLARQLHKWQVPLYLKIAVFSELKGARTFDPMIDYHGKQTAPYVLNPQESFEFRCPASPRNRRALTDIYEESFADLPFDGIFLDRIRYSSFLSGVAGIGGCFCPDCVKRYEAAGISVDQLRQRLIRLEKGEQLPLAVYAGGVWKTADPLLDAFFQVKAAIIEETVEQYASYFHRRGKKLGLDLFTPALGYFCGQDIQRLRQIADFVKPMMYRYTDAPAGLPFERHRLIQAVGDRAGQQFDRLAGGPKRDFEELVQRELTWLGQERGCSVWPGIEANYIEPIAPIRPEQIRQNLRLLQSLGYEQIVVSWNLNRIPPENMEALLDSIP